MPFNPSRRRSQPLAAVAVAGASLVAAAALASIFLNTARDSWVAAAAAGPASPADGILLVAGLVGTLLSLWLGLGMALSALSSLPGALGQLCDRLATRVAPAVVRKVVAFVLGTTLTAALVPGTALAGIGHDAARPLSATVVTSAQQAQVARSGVAAAAPDVSFRFLSSPAPGSSVPDTVKEHRDAAPPPLWFPSRDDVPASRASRTSPTDSRTSQADSVVVHRGDTLWSIASRHLGSSAGVGDIAAESRRWFAANRGVIGADPDLILPGQLLRPPPPGAGS